MKQECQCVILLSLCTQLHNVQASTCGLVLVHVGGPAWKKGRRLLVAIATIVEF